MLGTCTGALGRAGAQQQKQELTPVPYIHQETEFKASPERLYAALTDAAQFQQVSLLSAAVRSGMAKPAPAAEIDAHPGGAFSLFGGYITGRQIELIANQRIVQAWRPMNWPAGVYSIVRFELSPRAGGTLLTLDQAGFPDTEAEHLKQGWSANYLRPLAEYLARRSAA